MGEIWKMIPGYEPYEASDKGRIRRMHGNEYVILKPWHQQYGHLIIDMRIKGKRSPQYVHSLVATAFVDNPENKPCINHIDNNPENNKPSNLEWCTRKENTAWMMEQNRGTPQKAVVGTNIRTGKKMRINGINKSRIYGFDPSCVCECCRGKRQTHKGYIWRYAAESEM